jgi:hypothetical protein
VGSNNRGLFGTRGEVEGDMMEVSNKEERRDEEPFNYELYQSMFGCRYSLMYNVYLTWPRALPYMCKVLPV